MSSLITRERITPLTLGTFGLMAVTGGLMFFHLGGPLQEEVHAWAGWVLVGAVALHALANLSAFKRHFQSMGRAPLALALAVVVFGASYVLAPAGGGGPPVPAVAIQALSGAPIGQVAPLFGRTGAQARQALAAEGIVLPDDETPIARVAGGDRAMVGHALQVLARTAAGVAQ